MAWIESHQTLRGHPKLVKFCRALKITRPAAVGHLHLLWWWALDYAPDGNLEAHGEDVISEAAEWPKDQKTFLEALRSSGFMDDWIIHGWKDYAGKILDARSRNAERMRHARAGHVQDTCVARGGLPNQPNSTVPTVPSKIAQSPAKAVSEPDLVQIDGTDYKIPRKTLEAWKTAFPGVQIVEECRKAHAWEIANPARRKVEKQRFLNNWLARSQDAVSPVRGPGRVRDVLAGVDWSKIR